MTKLLDTTELTELFKVDRRTIYDWLRSGHLTQPVKRWGPPRWDEAEILHMVAQTPASAPSARDDGGFGNRRR